MSRQPTRPHTTVLHQLCNLIPAYLVAKLARDHGVDKQARTFSPWSHVVALLYAQLAHSMSLNDVCDSLKHHAAKLFGIRRATPPCRNTFSHANRTRDPKMAETLFWSVLDHLQKANPNFGGRHYKGMPQRFKRLIHIIDATTIQLVANCMDWARHRRKKAAAKMHMRLDLQSFLPRFTIVDIAREFDSTRARELCAGIGAGEIVLFDKAYIDFPHLAEMDKRGVFWVSRAKDNLAYRFVETHDAAAVDWILSDQTILLTGPKTQKHYDRPLRRVVARIEIKGKLVVMEFITNNMEWAASSIAGLYRSRWAIEAFFKELKQTLQLCDFLGNSKSAIQWQIWTALLLYVLLRFNSLCAKWENGFKRLFCIARSMLWDNIALMKLLLAYGTAGGLPRAIATAEQAFFPGFSPSELK